VFELHFASKEADKEIKKPQTLVPSFLY